jgi:hypothetical protein
MICYAVNKWKIEPSQSAVQNPGCVQNCLACRNFGFNFGIKFVQRGKKLLQGTPQGIMQFQKYYQLVSFSIKKD